MTLDDRVNEAKARLERGGVPTAPDLGAARDRWLRRRRRLVSAVVVAPLAAAGIVGLFILHRDDPPSRVITGGPAPPLATTTPNHNVPRTSTNTPSKVPSLSAPSTTTAPILTTKRPCNVADVKISDGGTGAALGHSATYIDVINTSTTACQIHGYLSVNAQAKGMPPVQATQGSYFVPQPGNGVMPPGGTDTFTLETDSQCAADPAGAGAPVIYDDIVIQLPGGTQQHAVNLDVRCGLFETAIGTP